MTKRNMPARSLLQVIEQRGDSCDFDIMAWRNIGLVIDIDIWIDQSHYRTLVPGLDPGTSKESPGQIVSAVKVVEYIEHRIETSRPGILILTARDWASVNARTLVSVLQLVSTMNIAPYGSTPVETLLIIRADVIAIPAK